MTTTRTARTEKLEELHQRLTAQVEALVTGEEWKAMLDVASKLHPYSARNVIPDPLAAARRRHESLWLSPLAISPSPGPQGRAGHRHPGPVRVSGPPRRRSGRP